MAKRESSMPRPTLEKLAFTIQEAAAAASIGQTSLYKAIRDKQLKARKYGTLSPSLQHDAPLPQGLAVLIGLLCIVTRDVVHTVLDNLLLEICLVLRPGTEGAAQAVHRQGRITRNFLERLQHRVVRHLAIKVAPGENVLGTGSAFRLAGCRRLGASASDVPLTLIEIELRPAHVLDLVRARHR